MSDLNDDAHAGRADDRRDDRLASAELGARVKVCGITEPSEIDLLAGQQVDFVGLWYGVPGGPADLPLDDVAALGAAAAAHRHLAPVLVTFLKDVDALREALEDSRRALGPAARVPDARASCAR